MLKLQFQLIGSTDNTLTQALKYSLMMPLEFIE